MIKVFFSGYGWWFYKHRINGGMYSISITDLGTPILFPLHDRSVDSSCYTNKLIRTTGNFYLEREDAYAYSQTKKTTHVKTLYPSNEYSIEDTFVRITEGLLIGMKTVIAEDCFFVIDNDQNPEFAFPDDNKNKQEEIVPDDLTNTETPPEIKTKCNKRVLKNRFSEKDILTELIHDFLSTINIQPGDDKPFGSAKAWRELMLNYKNKKNLIKLKAENKRCIFLNSIENIEVDEKSFGKRYNAQFITKD